MNADLRALRCFHAPILGLLLVLGQGCAAPSRGASSLSPSPEVAAAQAPLPVMAQKAGGALAGAPDVPAPEAHVEERKIVRDGSLTLEVRNETLIPAVLRGIHETTAKLGGYVASESTHGIVIKVPSSHLDDAVGALGSLATITKRELTARDVTSDYVDLRIRIDNARRLQERLKELLGQTADVARILEIEKELARVTEELERLEGQMRLMNNQTTFATLTISVEESVSPGPVGWVFVGLYKGVKWLFVWD